MQPCAADGSKQRESLSSKENRYKVKAFRRAAARLRTFSESIDELVREAADLTAFADIGDAIAACIRGIVLTGTLGRLQKLRAGVNPELAGISRYPRLDPKRVLRAYKELGIASIEALKEKPEAGEIEKLFGVRMAQHLQHGLTETRALLLYRADVLRSSLEECFCAGFDILGDLR